MQGSNSGLLHFRQILYQLSYQGSPITRIDGIRQVSKKLEGKPIGECEQNNTNSSFVDANYFME